MGFTSSDYSALLSEKKFLFVPTCLILEIMATVHGHLTRLPLSASPSPGFCGQTLRLLSDFARDLACTASAYETGRARWFVGDWESDRAKANAIFASLREKLALCLEMLIGEDQERLLRLERDMAEQWARLASFLDANRGTQTGPDGQKLARHFHCGNLETWSKTMARTLLALNREVVYDTSDTYLLLLCYDRVKTRLLRQIRLLDQTDAAEQFPDGKILCISAENTKLACPNCIRYTGELADLPDVCLWPRQFPARRREHSPVGR